MEQRPHVLDDGETWQTFMGYVRTGVPVGIAARKMGMTRKAVVAYMVLHPDKAAEYQDGEKEATELVEQALYDAARAGERWAVLPWLERRDRERWGKDGDGQGTVQVVMDPDALRELAAGQG